MMDGALSLFDAPADVDGLSIEERFEMFHRTHPEVYRELVAMTRRLVAAGRRRLGIAMLWETLRYQSMLGDPDAEYRLNNDLRAHYARLIMEQEPDLDGVFEIRTLRAAS